MTLQYSESEGIYQSTLVENKTMIKLNCRDPRLYQQVSRT
jgi:hypothetical protein